MAYDPTFPAARFYVHTNGNAYMNGAAINADGATGENKVVLTDNLADAFSFTEAANSYLKFVTTNSGEKIVAGQNVELASGKTLTMTAARIVLAGATGTCGVTLVDNLASAFEFSEAANSYLKFITTNGSEAVVVGQNVTIADGKNIALDTTTGTKIGTAVGQKLGFFNATPVVQPAHADQAAVAALTGEDAPTEAEHNLLVAAHNQLRADLVALGLIKGAA